MLEFNGIIEKIEAAQITNIDILSIKTDKNKAKLQLELVNRINPFSESDPIKIIFDAKPITKGNPKLMVKGKIYSISKDQESSKILISIGGLQLKIETSEDYEEFKKKQDLNISFF